MQEEIEQLEAVYTLLAELIVNYSFQFLGALIILTLGLLVANRLRNLVVRLCDRRELDVTLTNFVANVTKVVIMIMVGVVALGKMGISIGPFLAAVGALSLGAGLAVQGLLSNYGAGLAIVVTRPFVIGDTITVQGVSGLVSDILLASTRLTNEDGVLITIPNRHIMGEILHNSQGQSLVELTVGIPYASEPQKVITAIEQELAGLEDADEERPPIIGIDAFGDNSIDLGVRLWVPTRKLFQQKYEANARIHAALERVEVSIPFPQREVRMLGDVAEG